MIEVVLNDRLGKKVRGRQAAVVNQCSRGVSNHAARRPLR